MKVELAKKWYVLLLSFFVFCYLIDSAQAQDSSETTETSESRSPDSALESLEDKEVGQTDVEVEELYDKFDINETKRKSAEREKEKNKKKNDEKSKVDPSTLSELSTLAPLSDIAVIQRRFLPKTKRFEASGSLMATINNPFFTNLGAAIRAGYYFQEKYGVELLYFLITSNERDVTDNLRERRNVKTESIVTPQNYLGLDFKWTPIYGKTAFVNKSMVPFDFYFSAGLGMTGIKGGESASTIHLGAGQSFALSKSMALRWDFSWNFYQPTAEVLVNNELVEKKSNHDDLYLSLGMSFFFPEATYR